MPTEVTLPNLGDGVDSGDILDVLVQHGLAGCGVYSKLQFRVGDDDALALGIGGCPRVQRHADLADELGELRADKGFHTSERDVDVVHTAFRLGRRGKERLRQFLGFDQPLGQGLPADLAGPLIVRPA